MATLADSLVSSASRPLTLRMRPDLTARRQRYHGQSYWVVKEPIGLNYYRFHEEEYAILCMLDGNCSLEAIKEQFEQEYTPQKITFQDLQQFVGMLHRSGLVVAEAIGQGHQLRKRRDDKKRRELLGKFTNVFALRWRGIDPERILNRLYPWTGWFFSRAMVTFVLLTAATALLLIAVQFDVFRSRLPSFHQFFGNYQNWLVMAVVMGFAKVLHEFGHGLSCKRFGGECHEMGFMLLVFTPALYCNVSDSWMLPSKWHRAGIGAAGMYVEMFLASIATFIWWSTEPTTLLNQVCLSLMFICSVSTLLFNGNPLLRFDGYYILMDLIEIPNLRQKATEVLKRFLVQLCMGIEQPENPFLPQRRQFLFGAYSIAAVFYRWIVVFSILMFLNKVLEPYGLKVVGRMVGALGLFGLVVQPLWKLGKFFYLPGRMHKVKRHRVVASCAVVAALVAVVLFVPIPFSISANFVVKPRDAVTAYAAVEGRLIDPDSDVCEYLVRLGQLGEQGRLAILKDKEGLGLEIDLEPELRAAEDVLDRERTLRRQDPPPEDFQGEIRQIEQQRNQLRQTLSGRRNEIDRAVEHIQTLIVELQADIRDLEGEDAAEPATRSPLTVIALKKERDVLTGQLEELRSAARPDGRELADLTDRRDAVADQLRRAENRLFALNDSLYKAKDARFILSALTVLASAGASVQPGDIVKKGDVLAVMENIRLEQEVVALEGQLREDAAQMRALRKRRRHDPSAGLRASRLAEHDESLKKGLYEKKDDLYKLVVRAPEAGIILPVAEKPDRQPPDGQLPRWSGTAMQKSNTGAYLAGSDKICQIGDPQTLVAEIIIDQGDVELVRAAQKELAKKKEGGVPVVMMLDSVPGTSFESQIERVETAELTETPLGLSTQAGGDLDSVMDPETGVPTPLSTSYPAIAVLPYQPSEDGALQLGMRGKAKLYTGWQPLRKRIWRFVARTFHFEL